MRRSGTETLNVIVQLSRWMEMTTAQVEVTTPAF